MNTRERKIIQEIRCIVGSEIDLIEKERELEANAKEVQEAHEAFMKAT